MADYLLFVGEIVFSDTESSDYDKKLNVTDLTLEEEPVIQFNRPDNDTESLATAPV